MKKAKYFIIDFVSSEAGYDVEELSEKDFFESLKYNHSVAKDCGDDVPSIRKLLKELKSSEDYETDSINAFSYLKLTNQTLEEWGY